MERGNSRFAGRGAAAPAPAGRGAPTRGAPATRAPAFSYVPRTATELAKRAQGGDDFDKFLDGPKVWKPKDGLNTIRLMPPTFAGAEHWGMDIKVHFGVGPDRQSYLCLHKHKGEACPLCEERVQAQREGDEQGAKDLDAKTRVLVYLVDRDDEKAGVQAYAMPQGMDRDLVKVVVDPRTGEVYSVDDPYNGYDVSFTKSGQLIKTKYDGIQIARRESALDNDAALQYIQDHPLDTILRFYSYEHIMSEFSGGGSTKPAATSRDDAPTTRPRWTVPEPTDVPEVDWEYVHGLTSSELDALCGQMDELAEVDPNTSKDDDDLKAWICEVLNLVEPPAAPAPAPRRGSAPAPAAPAGGLARMRINRR